MGLAKVSSNQTYISTTYINTTYEGMCRLSLNTTNWEFTYRLWYIHSLDEYWQGYDIGYISYGTTGDIIMATDDPINPLKRYAHSSGNIVEEIPADIGIGSNIHGVTVDDNNFIWVSNTSTDMIYKIAFITGTAANTNEPVSSGDINVSSNPFHDSLNINIGSVTGPVNMEIYSLDGRLVHSASGSYSYLWDSSMVPIGSYVVKVTTEFGNVATKMVVKI